MTRLYEGMILLDNDAVRSGWDSAKAKATGLFEKHGVKVHTARRWGERRLAYPIKGRHRGTYLLTYSEIPADSMAGLQRDLEIDEAILRYLFLRADEVPQAETEQSEAEAGAEFTVPEPPADDAHDEAPIPADEAKPAEAKADEAPADEAKADEAPADEAKADEAPADEAKPDEAKADEAKADEAPADEAKADEAKADEAPADEAKADEAPADEAPADEDGVESETDNAGSDATGTGADDSKEESGS